MPLLEQATEVIKGYCRQHLERVEDDTITLDPELGQHVLMLPELPVIDVTAIELGGTALAVGTWSFTSWGALMRGNGAAWWPARAGAAVVTYTHGYQPIPRVLKGLCVEIAARAYVNPRQVASEQMSSYSARFQFTSEPTGMGLLAHERELLDQYRAR